MRISESSSGWSSALRISISNFAKNSRASEVPCFSLSRSWRAVALSFGSSKTRLISTTKSFQLPTTPVWSISSPFTLPHSVANPSLIILLKANNSLASSVAYISWLAQYRIFSNLRKVWKFFFCPSKGRTARSSLSIGATGTSLAISGSGEGGGEGSGGSGLRGLGGKGRGGLGGDGGGSSVGGGGGSMSR